jgi:acetyl-CoA decarbonylase/synthase complex subunit delta
MPDMASFAEEASVDEAVVTEAPLAKAFDSSASATFGGSSRETVKEPAKEPGFSARDIEDLKESIIREVKRSVTREIVDKIIGTLKRDVLGEAGAEEPAASSKEAAPVARAAQAEAPQGDRPRASSNQETSRSAADAVKSISTFKIRREKCECPIWTVKLGATKSEGGTRGRTYSVGGSTCMPFHLWEGEMPNRPLLALEVFDAVSPKYPAVLRKAYAGLLEKPAEMARHCVEKCGADLISVRLDGTHPEKGDRSPEDAVKLIKGILRAVDVPLIVTGHNHYEKNNEVMKAIARECAGENLLLNWVEQDNYRTIAGAAVAYGHTVVAQSPIDVNISKQLNILLTNMDVAKERIVIDPLTGSMGYGIEYTYSVMERIRLTGLGGDAMLAGPMIVNPGFECAKVKESRADEADFPAWGQLGKRATLWEISTAMSLLYAGADVLVMYDPAALAEVKKAVMALMDVPS